MINKISQRPGFKLIVQLFCEGDTEFHYLQKFVEQQTKREVVKINRIIRNSNPLYLARQAIAKYNDIKMKNAEVWVIFDHDGRDAEVKETINLIKNSGKAIHIAFMKPCIEIWPLLHNGIDNITSQSAAQSKLKTVMPSYDHERNPYFDLSKMPDYDGAVAKAKAWEVSLSGEPEYKSSKFAGIYKITEKIKGV